MRSLVPSLEKKRTLSPVRQPAVPVAVVARRTMRRSHWGWLPTLSLSAALGLLTVAAANRLSGSGVVGMALLFWLGLLIVVAPITVRLMTVRVARHERVGLLIVLALSLYSVKLMQSPFGFTYSDEFIHIYNANQIYDTGTLFAANPILPVSALYPGLESAAVALMHLTGLDVFGAGVILIGLARLTMLLALFLLYEQVSGSARVASIASLLYTANSNFLFWSAQFSYESLALPLAVLALVVVARRESVAHKSERLGLTLTAILLISAVVVTHHLSSYFLAFILLLWAIVGWVSQQLTQPWAGRLYQRLRVFIGFRAGSLIRPVPIAGLATGGPGGLALFAWVAAIFWLIFVASLTLHYLPPMFGKAVVSLISQIAGEQLGRGLFHSNSGNVAPLWERLVGIGSVLLCLAGLPFGLRQVWRRNRHHPLGLIMAAGAVAYFGLLGLRFVPSAWEISNRSSEFLFLGLAFVLASARVPRWLPRPLLSLAAILIFVGGIVAGWATDLRMAQVYQVTVGGRRLEPAGLSAARWVRTYLGEGNNFAADESNGRYLLAYGSQQGLTGRNLSVESVFESPTLEDWHINILVANQIEYLAVDRRLLSGDNMLGYFFTAGSNWPLPNAQLQAAETYTKFDQLPNVNRFFDSGDLVLYDIRTWINDLSQP